MRRTMVSSGSGSQTTFGSETETSLNRQIEVLTTLTAALLGELELLHSNVAATQTNSFSGAEPPLGETKLADFHIDFYQEVGRYEIALIKRALKHASGNQRKAAQSLAMNSSTLNAKIKHYGIHTLDMTAQYSSHLDVPHRPARALSELVTDDRIAATSEPERVLSRQRDSFVKFQDYE